MQYKTIVLGLIERRPKLHQRLWTSNHLQEAVDRYTLQLRNCHEEWKTALSERGSPEQVAIEAMELAIQEMQDSLPDESPQDESGPTLDGAMAYIMRHSPKG